MADMLAAPEDLASLLERDDVDTFKATLLIECATSVVQVITGQRIVEVTDDTVTLDAAEAHGGRYLLLPEQPVTSVSAVSIAGNAVTDYTAQYGRARLWRAYGWRLLNAYPGQPSTITVTYTHGYPAGHQRLQLARSAVLALIRGVYGNPLGATQIQIDDFNATFTNLSVQMDASPFLAQALRRQYGRPPGAAVLTAGSWD